MPVSSPHLVTTLCGLVTGNRGQGPCVVTVLRPSTAGAGASGGARVVLQGYNDYCRVTTGHLNTRLIIRILTFTLTKLDVLIKYQILYLVQMHAEK